ncbi:hypothetical protein LMH87_007430 [Akanthomyces muscarius]|uniref:Uncharacterized protein n=1 Tax=Akanthomyces muscarius TaxID=2231603 RepID=A0A9W8QRL6_AKAMU|nr:hypothetical protein LMH87_007430 [Akanthomyces muscarius]KAJ4165815.1 hypothetical protein LMH87_007430 [Akanthomyces muscarius]
MREYGAESTQVARIKRMCEARFVACYSYKRVTPNGFYAKMMESSNTYCQQPAARFLSSLYHNLQFASTNICLLNLTTAIWQANRMLSPSLLVNGVLSFASFCCGLHDLAYIPDRRGWSVTVGSARTVYNILFLLSYTFVAKDVAQLDLQSRLSRGLDPVQLQELLQSVKVTLALTRIECWLYLLFSAICVMGKYVA